MLLHSSILLIINDSNDSAFWDDLSYRSITNASILQLSFGFTFK